ncbi:UDP-N-acetylmuramyl pentapeptide phosphotransferase/UDP-N-acetylglucosamine-1-phosphate transferase [Rhodovulum bhavnagarense]|uniref:UDP-N-acetylmuramyl pentapeptide phosphotransferase/UDP-N-acetylglucosamine-1-phosphate transferase n=1 Tax=Rhodovulum bhavnagarense TaxID=992286 RepID=A0A4V2SVJ3_9RHOB|nr:glycosyltransferase [Rhodovulum bhavnagarense]TCP58756.1 UDP-N-acetylmuramyl pentapeptide phosphotransferase/UDP-N-acetylglucosamine-1-phosphate transferase [Rhodovulum bhavnagarense]
MAFVQGLELARLQARISTDQLTIADTRQGHPTFHFRPTLTIWSARIRPWLHGRGVKNHFENQKNPILCYRAVNLLNVKVFFMGPLAPVWLATVVFAISAMMVGLMVGTRGVHVAVTTRGHDLHAIQAAHTRPTPRVGGLAVVVAICCALLLGIPNFPKDRALLFIASLLPVFIAGLAEDLGYRVSPRGRLWAAALSSMVVVFFMGDWITESGLPGVDLLLAFAPFAIPVTILWTTGLCHAFNLIDGVNGLMGGVALMIALALAFMSHDVGYQPVMVTSLAVAAALAGFLMFNFPKGQIFMGDAGAYTVGHVLAWLGIFLAIRSEEIAGISVALLFFWPVADTFLAIYRRRASGRRHDQPDRLHVHQLVMRGLEIVLLGRGRRHISNPLTAVVLMPLAGMPVLAGVVFMDRPIWAALSVLIFAVLFVLAYRLGMAYVRHGRRGRAGRN